MNDNSKKNIITNINDEMRPEKKPLIYKPLIYKRLIYKRIWL